MQGDWIGQVRTASIATGLLLDLGADDVADAVQFLVEGFPLIAEAVKAERQYRLAHVAASRPYPPLNIFERINKARERADEAHAAAWDFLRGAGE